MAMKKKEVVGREQELKTLEEFFNSENAEFMAIYGRRRVGKTFLIRSFFKSKSCFFFNVTGIYKASLKQQLQEFSKEIGKTFFQGTMITGRNNWFDMFELLTNTIEKLPKRKKVVLFFDEFPWMATPRSKLLQALEYYWNHYWSQKSKALD